MSRVNSTALGVVANDTGSLGWGNSSSAVSGFSTTCCRDSRNINPARSVPGGRSSLATQHFKRSLHQGSPKVLYRVGSSLAV